MEIKDDGKYLDSQRFRNKYANSILKSTWLILKRCLIIWRRDRRVLIANAVKNSIMGISVGGVFFQTEDVISILGVLFQGMLFIMLGGMTTAPGFVEERAIFYKHADANFFSPYPFAVGKALSKLPQVRPLSHYCSYVSVPCPTTPVYRQSWMALLLVRYSILWLDWLEA